MRHIWWVLGLKKNSPLIAVRIEVLCFYTFFNNFKIVVFSGYQIEVHSKGSQFSIFFWFLAVIFGLAGVRICNGNTLKRQSIFNFFWFLAVIFGLAGVRICNGITLKSVFFSKSHKFS